MADRHSPAVRRRRLSAELKRLREASGLTAKQVGDRLGWSRGRLTNMERNKWKRPDPMIIRALAREYGASDDHVQALETLARESRGQAWWERYEDVFTDSYVAFEAEATTISTYQTMVVHGLLQTPEYADAADRAIQAHAAIATDRAVEARLERQEILDREDSPKLWAVIDESVLLRTVGSAEIMRGQIEKLVRLSKEFSTIKIQVMPLDAGVHPGAAGSFTILDFPDPQDPPMVYVETRSDGLYFDEPEEIETHRDAWDDIRVRALHPAGSLDHMLQLIKRYE